MFNSIHKRTLITPIAGGRTIIQSYGSSDTTVDFDVLGNKKSTHRMYQTLHFFRQFLSKIMDSLSPNLLLLRYNWMVLMALMSIISSTSLAFNPIVPVSNGHRVIKTPHGVLLKENKNRATAFMVGPDIGITKSSDKASAKIGDQVTFTLKVYNEGDANATNVVVHDPIPLGTSFVSSIPNGAYNVGAGTWSVGIVPQGDTLTFSYIVKIVEDGVAISEAEVSAMTEIDSDSVPNDGNPSQDDWASACVSIPIYYCNSNQIEIEVEAPAIFQSVKWYRNGVLVDTNKVYTIKDFGNYHYEATTNGPTNCPVELCCPIQVIQKCLAVGNLVWADLNNNGIKDNNESGLENIEVVLFSTGIDTLKNANDIAIDTILTDVNGNYLFDNLAEGNYYVKLQDVPTNYASSTGQGIYDNDHAGPYENGPDSDNNLNNNDDGTEMVGTAMIMSSVFTLTYDAEPVDDDDTDNNTNTTIDFGLYEPQTFDVALNKTLAAGQPASFNLGDSVTFTINVYNQGTVKAYNIEVSDYIPNGLILADSAWTQAANLATATIDSLDAGETVALDISFTISPTFSGTSITNAAEIGKADDDKNSNNGTPTDADSTPDKNATNDGSPKNDEINEDGKNGGDEDDHDFEQIPVTQPNPTLSLGNLIWNDTDNDGVKDATEQGIAGIQVVLFEAGTDGKDPSDTAVDTLTTDANGNYLFSGLPEGIYYVVLTGNGIPFGMVSSNGLGTPYQAGNGSHEPGVSGINNQDNGTQMGTMIMSDTIHLVINSEPINDGDTDPNTNLTVDFGLHKPILPAPTLSIGNLVWNDVNNNGQVDSGEQGIPNVQVILYDAGTNGKDVTDIPLDTVLTNSSGNYSFNQLPEGNYYIKLTGVGIPKGWYSSTGDGPEDYDLLGQYEPASSNDVNNEDNGTMMGTMVMSEIVELTEGDEPANDGDTDTNTNLTIDFGFFRPDTFDLALNKRIADGQSPVVSPGDTLIYTLDVTNLGNIEGVDVVIADYLPADLILADNNWVDIGGVALLISPIPSILPGETASVNIITIVDPNFQGGELANFASIDTPIDSFPDNDTDRVVIEVRKNLLSLGDLVWEDLDNDGQKDPSEKGIAGVALSLYNAGNNGKDATDTLKATTTTDADGFYLFKNLQAGNYYVKITGGTPSGYISSTGNGPNDTGTAGTYEPSTVVDINNQDNGTQMGSMIMSNIVVLEYDKEPINDGDNDKTTNLTVDFGLYKPTVVPPTLSIGNLVWNDVNNNGLFDNGEQGIPNVQVILFDAGTNGKDGTDVPVDTALTNSTGNYLFNNLPEGNYYIKLTGVGIPQGWYSSTGDGPEDYDLEGQYEPAKSNDINNADNGTMMGTMVMSEIVELTEGDEPANDGDTNTNTNLTIDFGFFRPDTFDLALHKRIADGQSPVIAPGDTLIYTIDVTNLGNIEGADVVVADYLPADLILADDNWVDIGGVALLINPIPSILPGETASVNIITIVNPSFEGGSLANFATIDVVIDSFPDNDTDRVVIEVRKNLLSLGDTVWEDLDNDGQKDPSEKGIAGVTLSLYNAGNNGKDVTDTLKATTTTDADGFYLFKNLQAGNYYVKITGGVPSGYISSTGNGPNDTGTAGNYEPSTVVDANNQDNGTQMGSMIMSNIVVLEYDKEPINDGDNDKTTNLTVDFGLYKPVVLPSGLSGKAFVDCNNDGVSTGDSPLAGITVTLTGGTSPQTDTTDINGIYTFGSLAAGNYTLTFSKPTGLDFTVANTGSNDAIDSDVNAATGAVSFTLTAGQDAVYDAGYADKIAPIFTSTTVPNDITVECDLVPSAATLLATDSYDKNVDIKINEVSTLGNCKDSYTLTRVWTASDDCGNTATVQQVITVRDTKAPTINASSLRDLTVACGAIPAIATNITASDNCDTSVVITFAENRLDGNCLDAYVLVRTWTATDNCNNQTPFVQRITVQDIIAPNFTSVVQDLTVGCDEVPGLPPISATDNCDIDVRIILDEDNIDGNCEDNYQIIRTWTAVDNCSNTATLRQTITVRDIKAPTLSSVPATVTINCGQTVNVTPVATDLCDKNVEVTIAETAISGDCITGRTATRTYTAKDNCGNTSTFVQTIYVIDSQVPSITGTPANVTVTCKELPPPAKVTVQDNCPDAIMVMFDERKTNGDNCTGYILTRTWTAMDACGNTASYQQTITINGDLVAPIISGIPANADYDCADNIPTPVTASVSDDCDNNPKLTFTEDKLGDGCGYKLVRIWTATDACGNKSTKEQIITVRDRTAPSITGVPSDLTVDCADALPQVATPIASDVCDSSVSLVYQGKQTFGDKDACEYQVIRTWTATDKCGNTTSKSQTIRVKDTKAPTVTPTHPMFVGVPNGGTVTIECEKDLIVMDDDDATATDNCDKNPKIKFDEFDATKGDCLKDGYSFKISCRWTATDKCGNSSAYVVHVLVKDTKAPIVTNVAANITLNCGETIPRATTPSVSDNCDNTVDVAFNETTTPGNCPGTSTIRRTWTATDDCGNKTTATQTIVIEDKVAPVIANVPTNQTVACGQTPSDAQKPNVSDNCDASVTLTYTDATSTNGGCLGAVIRTWIATDDCGNTVSAQQTITIEDKTAPILVGVPANMDASCDFVVTPVNVTATDNCDKDVKIDYKEDKVGQGCQYKLIRTWTATDDCGNTAVGSQVINVKDTKAPRITLNVTDITIDCKDLTSIPTDATATDDCDKDVTITHQDSNIGTGCNYQIKRTFTAKDDCDNTATAVLTVTVQDKTAPVITFKDPILIAASSGDTLTFSCDNLPAYNEDSANAEDDCSGVKLTKNDKKVEFIDRILRDKNCIADGYLQLLYCEWKATDNCGNTSSWHMYVKIIDNKAPVLAGVPTNLTLNCGQTPPAAPTVTATDNCTQSVKVTYVETPMTNGACVLAGSVIRTWTATDECGNVAVGTQRVVISDTEKPEILGVPATDITISENEVEPTVNVKAVDKCDTDVTLTKTEAKTTVGCDDITTYTITATDDCANTTTVSYKVIRKKTTDLVATVQTNSTPEKCNAKDGSIVMTPANYTYTWADGFVGATRNNLTAGTYTITVTDGACARKVITVTVDAAACPPICVKPKLVSSNIIKNGCGSIATGSISFTLDVSVNAYNFAWSTPNGNATSATGLAEGSYNVTVTQKTDATCFEVFTFAVTKEDCPPACIKPKLVSSNIIKNGCGSVATGSISFTLDVSVNAYNFAWSTPNGNATSATGLAEGSYNVTVTQKTDATCFEVFTFAITKEDCPPICIKPALDGFNVTESGCGTTGTGSIIFNLKDGNTNDYNYVWNTTLGNQNIANGLTAGLYSVTVTRKSDITCFDVFTFNVIRKTPVNVFTDDALTLEVTDCQNGKALVCSNLKPSDITNSTYTFTNNGAPFLGSYKGCKFDTSYYYNPKLTVGQNPYLLTAWLVNGKSFNGEFNTVTELVTLMNNVDKGGNWILTQSGNISGGNRANVYGRMDVRSKNNPTSATVIELETKLTPYSMGLQVGEGTHIIVATDADGCTDEIKVKVECRPLPPTCQSFILWDSENVFTNCGTPGKICFEELPFAQIADLSILDNGTAYTGGTAACTNGGTELTLSNGVHQLIFIKKDGCRDTSTVKVACTTARLIKDTVYVAQKDTVCLDVAELIGDIKAIKNIWPNKSGEHAKFELIPNSRCVTCLGVEAGGTEEAAYVIEDNKGVFDTTYFQITVLERKQTVPSPEAVADATTTKEGEVMILDVLANDKLGGAKLTSIKIVQQPKNGSVTVDQLNRVVFAPNPDFCNDDEDESFSYQICTVGGCDEAPVTIKVLCSNIKVYTGFSPNGDGVNDFFTIEGVNVDTDNKLSIFNRWGNQVYYKEHYRNDWGGTWDGKQLSDGTYFYLYEDGKGNKKAGYVQIQR
jgi:uncharacterized repeat protein (TIGR01451 family)/gliding motility-associated-like protein